jgi:UDP-glucose 4-epimerase
MQLIVLGGTGFIGSYVVDHLIAAGHSVCSVSRGPEALRPTCASVDYLHLDLREAKALDVLAAAIAKADAVLHLVSTTVPGTGDRDPKVDIADNLVPLLRLMEIMLSANVHRLIYLSSGGAVYGSPKMIPVREDHALNPISSYGIVKVAAESYVNLFARTRGLSSAILRPSNPYGERQGREANQGLVNTLLRRAMSGDSVQIWGDGTAVRDFLYVDDLARLIVLAVESTAEGIFNVGSGSGTSVRQMVEVVESVTRRPLKVEHLPGRSVDPPVSILDSSLASQTFGWTPKVELRDGVARTWEWLKATANQE